MKPFSKATVFAVSLGLLVVLGAFTPAIRKAIFSSLVSPVLDKTETGDFFRLKVDVDYRGTPMPFDIVVSCHLRITRYRDFSSSVEASGLTPTLFGRVSPDGKKTVAVRPPVFCQGETTDNGQVPANFMPLMVVFPSTEWFDFAIAYVQDEAYDSPLSDLKFHKASVHKATYDEFVAFRKAQPNAINVFASDQSMDKPPEVWKANADFKHPQALRQINFCHFWTRFHVGPLGQQELVKYWPNSKPEYWTPPPGQPGGQYLGDMLVKERFVISEDPQSGLLGSGTDYYGHPSLVPDKGILRADHTGIHRADGYVPPYRPAAIYPDALMWQIGKLPENPIHEARQLVTGNIKRLSNIDLRPEARGFAYCWPSYAAMRFRIEVSEASTRLTEQQLSKSATEQGQLPYWQGVNDLPVTNVCRDGTWAIRPQSCEPSETKLEKSIVLERDEFALHQRSLGLGVLRGKL